MNIQSTEFLSYSVEVLKITTENNIQMKQSLKMTLKCAQVYVIFISLACSNMGLVPPRFGIKCAIYKTKIIIRNINVQYMYVCR